MPSHVKTTSGLLFMKCNYQVVLDGSFSQFNCFNFPLIHIPLLYKQGYSTFQHLGSDIGMAWLKRCSIRTLKLTLVIYFLNY